MFCFVFTDDFVEEADALHAFVDILRVEFGEVGDAGEHDADALFPLRVQFLLQL